MSTIQSQIQQHIPAGLKHDVFFKEMKHQEKGWFGIKKTVRRLHLATQDASGQTVILDQKGIRLKKTSSLFGQTFRTTAESGRFKEHRVNNRSLKHFLTRLEGKKVTWIKEKNDKSALGQRILKATGDLFKADITPKVDRLLHAHSDRKLEVIRKLTERENQLVSFIENSPSNQDKLELQRVRRQLELLNKQSEVNVVDDSDLKDIHDQLSEYGINHPKYETVFRPQTVSISWKVDRPRSPSPVWNDPLPDAALDETNLDHEQRRIERNFEEYNAKMKDTKEGIEYELNSLRRTLNPSTQVQEKIKHYENVLERLEKEHLT